MMKRFISSLSGVVILSSLTIACGGADGGTDNGSAGPETNTGAGGAGSTGGNTTSSSGNPTGTGGSTGTGNPGTQSSHWVSGYYVGYQQWLYPPDAVDFNSLTHLFMGRIVPNSNGTLNTSFDIGEPAGPELAKDMAARAHQANRKAILMLGGAGTHGGWVGAASDANRATFVANLLQKMDELGYDGLDLDWEPLEAQDQAPFRALAEALRAARPDIILALPVGWASSNFGGVNPFYGEIAPLLDQINIMSYGMAGAWPGWQTWHSSALHGEGPTTPTSISVSVNAYLNAGVPAAKLGMGIGSFGMCWTGGPTAPKQSSPGLGMNGDDNSMSYTNIMNTYYEAGARHWDSEAVVPYLSFSSPKGPEGCTFLSYEDEESIAAKGAYAKEMGLGGTIIWTIGGNYLANQPDGQRNPLLKAAGEAFIY